MALVQALTYTQSFGAGPHTISFTSNLVTHEGGASGSNPTAGNDLIVVWRGDVDRTVASCDTNQSDTGTEEHTGVAGGNHIYRISNISSSVTGIVITFTGGSEGGLMFVYEDDETLTADAAVAYATLGYQTAPTQSITTGGDDAFVATLWRASGGTRDWGDSGDYSALALDTAEAVVMSHATRATAATSNTEIAISSGSTVLAGSFSYTRSGGGAPAATPKGPFNNPFAGPFGGPI